MLQLILGSTALSILHALLPNHWIPVIAIGRSQGWSRKEILWVTAIIGSAHTLSTIIIGIIVGLIGYQISAVYTSATRLAIPLVLISLGIIYLILHYRQSSLHTHIDDQSVSHKSKISIITTLSIAMFFSPCIEIEAYFFTAGSLGWTGIALVAIIYYTVTISGMLLFVNLALKGIERINLDFLRHRENLVTAITLIVLGIIAYFITF